ncbi:polysaccharide biosynthesis protein [Thermodesulfobium narugense DSM 14796]|uniref:Polysaccharide biosynthesis protein n=1 Tax=Thermodesulfobium narugense DSM 14796 TaxID=747365 RepID=M1E747_9BACT|nr:flippase [Thermodesulfobium narugense]AEE14483.1 polysaccharide biosynthesis protein [Thermodesulfobium narugense DSM 14796]
MVDLLNLFSIRNIFNSQEKKRLVSNFFSLSILQVANYLFPLITLPYLVRVLGPSHYGLVAFAQAFIGYFQILTNYGFNLSATREISINRESSQKVSEIFSSVITIQILLAILSFMIMALVVLSFAKFRDDLLLYIFTFGMVVGNVLFPVWFFQGIERMKYITLLSVLARLIFTIAIFVFIHEESDYIYVPLINSIGMVLSGTVGLWLIFNRFDVKFIMPDIESIKYHLNEGWHIFISTVAISLYTISNTFILGLFASSEIVGYYSAAEKIIRAVQGLMNPIFQASYPYISKLSLNSKELTIVFIKKLLILFGITSFLFSLINFIFSNIIITLIFGKDYQNSISVFRILSFLPFIITLGTILGTLTMVNFGYKKIFTQIIMIGSIINIFLSLILVPIFKDVGTAYSVVITEIFITLADFIYLFKNEKQIFI